MKKIHKDATYFATQIPTQCSVQGNMLSALVICLVCSVIVVVSLGIYTLWRGIPRLKNNKTHHSIGRVNFW